MLTRLTESCLANPIVTVVTPTLFSVGKGASAMGGALFGMLQFLEKITGEKNSSISLPIAITTMAANFVLTSVTRIPAIFQKFNNTNNNDQVVFLPSHFLINDIHALDLIKEAEEEAKKVLSCCQNAFVHLFTLIGGVSGTFASLSAYLSAITLAEFCISQISETNLHDAGWKEDMIQIFAVFIALSNLMSFLAYNVEDVTKNVKALVLAIKNRSCEINRYMILSALISAPVLISSPFVANFSTTHALGQLPFKIPNEAIKYIAFTSAGIKLTTDVLTYPITTYEFLTKSKPSNKENTRCQMTIANITVLAGGIDSIAEGCKTFVGVYSTLQKFGILQDYPIALIAFSMGCGISAVVSNMTFGVRKGVLQYLDQRSTPTPIYYERVPNLDMNEYELFDISSSEESSDHVEIDSTHHELLEVISHSQENPKNERIHYTQSPHNLFQPKIESFPEHQNCSKNICVIL